MVVCGVVGVSGCSKQDTPAAGTVVADKGNTVLAKRDGVSPIEAKPVIQDGHAVDQPAPKSASSDDSFEILKKDYIEAVEKYRQERREEAEAKQKAAEAELKAAEKALQDAITVKEKQAAQQRLQKASIFPAQEMISSSDGPGKTFSPRLLAFAIKKPTAPTALDALYLALVTSGGPTGKVGT